MRPQIKRLRPQIKRLGALLRPTVIAGTLAGILLSAAPVLATQTHGAPEGLYVHQMAHLFFIISMGSLEFWLRQRNLVEKQGWKYIQIAAMLFILWNIDAMLVHFMDEHLDIIGISKIDFWHIRIESLQGQYSLAVLYYLFKLDHLLCVPAMFFLYRGLRCLVIDADGGVRTDADGGDLFDANGLDRTDAKAPDRTDAKSHDHGRSSS